MRILFILNYVPICILFLFRKIDLFSIIFFTSSLYFLPAFFGFAVSDYRVIDVSYLTNSTYCFYIFYFIILTICSIVATGITKYFIKNSKTIGFPLLLKPDFDDWIFALRIICPSALWLAWFITPDGLFQGDKNQLLSQLGWIYSFFQYATVFYIVLSFFSKRFCHESLRDNACCSTGCGSSMFFRSKSHASIWRKFPHRKHEHYDFTYVTFCCS
jgi:hypothetical protein